MERAGTFSLCASFSGPKPVREEEGNVLGKNIRALAPQDFIFKGSNRERSDYEQSVVYPIEARACSTLPSALSPSTSIKTEETVLQDPDTATRSSEQDLKQQRKQQLEQLEMPPQAIPEGLLQVGQRMDHCLELLDKVESEGFLSDEVLLQVEQGLKYFREQLERLKQKLEQQDVKRQPDQERAERIESNKATGSGASSGAFAAKATDPEDLRTKTLAPERVLQSFSSKLSVHFNMLV